MGMSIMVLRGNNLEIKLGLVFMIEPPLKSSLIDKTYPHSKEGQYTYSNRLTNLETIIL